ncbi:MAG TPA: TonB-dependent receptor [Cyclobacteriaceae bacterium]|nr:TonB-dependent receptor [Cyclobacteriaceae bacterium]
MKDVILLVHRNRNRWPRLWFTLMLAVIGHFSLFAQTVVKGKVTDETGAGMPGVNIVLKNTTNGSTTDAQGDYSISIPVGSENGTLVFSFIGYNTQEEQIGNRSTINVGLTPSIESLSEVVVVGYGVQQKRDVTGAIVSLKSETLREVASPNVFNQLKGRAAGITIVSNASTPGASGQIRVRGARTLVTPANYNSGGGSDQANGVATAALQDAADAPLLVVDGIPYGGSINDISPNDIASLEILKDASATAIYGSRGAGGVILITTKRGKSGKTTISYDGFYGSVSVMDELRTMNGPELAQFKLDAAAGNKTAPGTTSYPLTAAEQAALDAGISTNWQDLIYQKGYQSSHNITASGGTDAAQYSVGLNYWKETGIIPNQNFERFSIRATVDTKVSERIKIGLNTINTLSYSNLPGGNGVPSGLMRMTPLASPYNADGSVNLRPQVGHIDEQAVSPLTLISKDDAILARTRRLRTFNSLYGEVQILKDLKYRLNVGLDYSQQQSDNYAGANTYVNTAYTNSQSNENVRNSEFFQATIENLLIYNKTINDKHNIGFTGLFSAQKDHAQGSGIFGLGMPADYFQAYNFALANTVSAKNPSNSGDNPFNFSERGLLSFMGRATYGYDGRYSVTATVRRDGSSILAPGHQWLTYPAFAAAWNISNENFMSDVSFVTNLKLRAGWGRTGNQSFPPYTTLGSLSSSAYNFGKTAAGNQIGYLVTTLPNNQLGWEHTDQYNIGLDFGFFGNRLTGAIEYYQQDTEDILLNVLLPPSIGANSTAENLGKTRNRGLEITVSGDIIKNPDGFNWSVDAVYFFNRNEIVELQNGVEKDVSNGWFVGQPMSVIYDVKKIGIWQAGDAAELATQTTPVQHVGEVRVQDLDGNNIINADDRQIIGNFQPKWEGGLTNRFTFKGFDLTVITYARMGMKIVVPYLTSDGGFNGYFAFNQGRVNQLKVDYWTPNNPTNAFPEPDASRDKPVWSSTLGYQDGSFIKCRSINLGYTFANSLLSKTGLTSARIYVSAVNPFVIYSPFVDKGFGPDPEGNGYGGAISSPDAGVSTSGAQGAQITVNANIPSTRQFLVGVNLKF